MKSTPLNSKASNVVPASPLLPSPNPFSRSCRDAFWPGQGGCARYFAPWLTLAPFARVTRRAHLRKMDTVAAVVAAAAAAVAADQNEKDIDEEGTMRVFFPSKKSLTLRTFGKQMID